MVIEDHLDSNFRDALCTKRGKCSGTSALTPGTHPSRASNWQPLHTPSENVSLRALKRSNSGLKVE